MLVDLRPALGPFIMQWTVVAVSIAVCQNVVVGAFPTVHFTRKHDIHQNQVRSVPARLFNRVLTGHGDAGHFIGNPPRESQAAQTGIGR